MLFILDNIRKMYLYTTTRVYPISFQVEICNCLYFSQLCIQNKYKTVSVHRGDKIVQLSLGGPLTVVCENSNVAF